MKGNVIIQQSVMCIAIFNNGIARGFDFDKVSKGKESLVKHSNEAYNKQYNGGLYECEILKFKKRSKEENQELIESYKHFLENIFSGTYVFVDKNLKFNKEVEEI